LSRKNEQREYAVGETKKVWTGKRGPKRKLGEPIDSTDRAAASTIKQPK